MDDAELLAMADELPPTFVRRARTLEDFRYDEQQEKYWDTTTGILLGAKSVDGAVPRRLWPTREKANGELAPTPPSQVINGVDTGLTVEGSTWWPGEPRFMHDRVVTERGVMRVKGAVTYNSYVGPRRPESTASEEPTPWLEHVRSLYPDPLEHDHFFDFCAHALQRPYEKVNHGLVLTGLQGVGKDTALLPVRAGVGEWNVAEVAPDAVVSAYNGHVKSVLLVVNEVRPHDEDYRAANFYQLLKPLLATPPAMLPMTLKYANTIYVRNLCHVVLTTNDPLTMYIPDTDRRLFVLSSPQPANGAGRDHFDTLHRWLSGSGTDSVINWLLARDISGFDVAAPPPMTAGKRAIIDSAAQVRRSVADDVVDDYMASLPSAPVVIFHRDLTDFVANGLFDDGLSAMSQLNAKNFHFKMAERGYDLLRNPDAREWRNGAWRTRVAFVRSTLSTEDRLIAVRAELARKGT